MNNDINTCCLVLRLIGWFFKKKNHSKMSVITNKNSFIRLINKIKSSKNSLNDPLKISKHLLLPSPPTALPLWKIIKTIPFLFPRSINKSYEDYKLYHSNVESIQHKLFSTLKFFPFPDEGKVSKIIKTPIDTNGNYINEFCISPENTSCEEEDVKHLIFIHGYGAGIGFFLKNIEKIPLVENKWQVHYIDLPGFGFSTRLNFPFKYPKDSPRQVENWFHKIIQNWFQKRNLLVTPQNNMVIAHSLGAYFMILYKNTFPDHFKKMILCSPAGICNGTTNDVKNKIPWWFNKLWERNISPFSLVRNTHILGSKLTSGWSYKRFKKITTASQFEALHRYTYAIFNKQGSGEYSLPFVLKCGGDPRAPIEERIINSKQNWDSDSEWVWLYGEIDWMNIAGGKRISEYIVENNLGKSSVIVIPDAGHHLYLDNYPYFNELIQNEMKCFLKKG